MKIARCRKMVKINMSKISKIDRLNSHLGNLSLYEKCEWHYGWMSFGKIENRFFFLFGNGFFLSLIFVVLLTR